MVSKHKKIMAGFVSAISFPVVGWRLLLQYRRKHAPASPQCPMQSEGVSLLQPLPGFVARDVVGGIGNISSASLTALAIVAASISVTGTACSASTVKPAGPASAKPPRTTIRSERRRHKW